MKIEEQVLSREQMAHLKELGVDTSDASMVWIENTNMCDWRISTMNPISRLMCKKQIAIPTYTIGDLIEKLPKSVDGDTLLFEFCFSDVGYGNWECSELYGINGQQNFKDKPLKDALYDLLCWVAENHKVLIN